MKEWQINEKRNWKGIVFPYDEFFPDESRECQVCLTEKQTEILRGIVEPLAWTTRWFSDENDINQTEIQAFRDDLIRRLMMSCCDGDVRYKYVGIVLYKSTDGGLTYEPSPGDDYRNTSVEWPKPSELGIDSTKCQAADSVVQTFKTQMVESIADDQAIAGIIGAIAAIIIFFASAGTTALISAQIAALCAAIFAAGVATWKALFTSDIWDQLRCLVFENMVDDESIDQAGIDNLYSQIGSNFSGIVSQILQGYVSVAGLIGINNMMHSNIGDADANCDDCDSTCNTENWSIKIYNGNPIGSMGLPHTGYIDVTGTSHPDFPYAYNAMIQTMDADICCVVDSIELLSGSMPIPTIVNCGSALWPDSGTHGSSFPVEVNTLYLHTDIGITDPFVCRIHFQ